MDESLALPVLMEALQKQSLQEYRLVICVNQPDVWWSDETKQRVCRDNQEVIAYIRSLDDSRIVLLDRSSPGNGWTDKAFGIGWARKTVMDWISANAKGNDLIVSMDADTVFGPLYLESVAENFRLNPRATAFSIPYYHPLSGNEAIDRAALRYEIYMRAYAINLWRIGSPYCFSALGSAIALPVRSYRAIGGMTPKLSGEDFYFLQKLVKFGTVIHWNGEMVYPAARLSERVFFGTGPALIKGMSGNWSSYPIYRMDLFDTIAATYRIFPDLFIADFPTPLDGFLSVRKATLPWTALRKNARTREQFVRSCHEVVDGLRILQYLKEMNRLDPFPDEYALMELLEWINKTHSIHPDLVLQEDFDFRHCPLPLLDSVRNALANCEMNYRRQHWMDLTGLNPLFN